MDEPFILLEYEQYFSGNLRHVSSPLHLEEMGRTAHAGVVSADEFFYFKFYFFFWHFGRQEAVYQCGDILFYVYLVLAGWNDNLALFYGAVGQEMDFMIERS